MLRRLKFLGFSSDAPIPQPEYDPVYGLPRRSLEEWLARNPQLREEYEVLAGSPAILRSDGSTRRRGNRALAGGMVASEVGRTAPPARLLDPLIIVETRNCKLVPSIDVFVRRQPLANGTAG